MASPFNEMWSNYLTSCACFLSSHTPPCEISFAVCSEESIGVELWPALNRCHLMLSGFDGRPFDHSRRPDGASRQMAMFTVGWVAFWAFDFEEKSDQGVSGREDFLDRVKEPIRRPPANMAAFTVEQHLTAQGVLRIQIADGPSLPGQYQICKLKTIGWYAAQMVSPKG